jgi:two-component system chemotaxis response regulator CheV
MGAGLLDSIDRSTQLAGHNRLALLLFRLDERQVFGINVFKVREVIPCPALSWMPSSHAQVAGVAEIRGRVVPVIDLHRAIGGDDSSRAAAHVIVTEFNRSVQGFLVRAVDRIVHVDVTTVEPPPAGPEGYLTATTRVAGELVGIIDVEKVLGDVVGEPPALSEALRERIGGIGAGRWRVLVADDSRMARNQIEKLVGELGLSCTAVNNGREALHHLQGMADRGVSPRDELLMVISDVEMPDMDGYSLTTEIRRDPRMQGLYVLLHSSLSGVFNNAMVSKVGADRFIAKFSANDLAEGILERLQMVSG